MKNKSCDILHTMHKSKMVWWLSKLTLSRYLQLFESSVVVLSKNNENANLFVVYQQQNEREYGQIFVLLICFCMLVFNFKWKWIITSKFVEIFLWPNKKYFSWKALPEIPNETVFLLPSSMILRVCCFVSYNFTKKFDIHKKDLSKEFSIMTPTFMTPNYQKWGRRHNS